MILSAIWDKSAQVTFQRPTKLRASAICILWKNYECWFIPNCTRKIMQLLSYNYTKKISLCFHFWLFLFFVMAYQLTELFAFPCCRSFWDFPSTICFKFLKPLSRIIQCLCSFSDNSGNHYLKTITLMIFPIFHMYCYVKLL